MDEVAAEEVGELSHKSMSNGRWGREGSLDSTSSKHRIDEGDKDPNDLSKKENTPKRVKVEVQIDPSPESNLYIVFTLAPLMEHHTQTRIHVAHYLHYRLLA